MSNSAPNGGAMVIGDSSKLLLNNDLQLNFVENQAEYYGGAIAFENDGLCTDSWYIPDCIIELSSIVTIQLNFSYNSAGKSGSVLFGGELNMCQLYIGNRDSCDYKLRGGYFAQNSFDTIKNISYIESSSNDTSAFSSKPFKVCLCGNNEINCSADIKLETITGKAIFIQVVTVGQ